MNNFSRERHSPIELIKYYWSEADVSHITYDPKMTEGDYDIIKSSGHDGTRVFTDRMLQEALLGILNMVSFFKPKPPKDWEKVKGIKYTVGPMRHATVFGMIKLKCSEGGQKYPGQRERVRMPVKCEFVYS